MGMGQYGKIVPWAAGAALVRQDHVQLAPMVQPRGGRQQGNAGAGLVGCKRRARSACCCVDRSLLGLYCPPSRSDSSDDSSVPRYDSEDSDDSSLPSDLSSERKRAAFLSTYT